MKRFLIKLQVSVLFSFGVISASAQVGINTEDPQGIFHIDPYNDGIADEDIIVKSVNDSIRVGIHTDKPGSALHIKGKMRISDGYENKNYVFKAQNSTGLGKWEDPDVKSKFTRLAFYRTPLSGEKYPSNEFTYTFFDGYAEVTNECGLTATPATGRVTFPAGAYLVIMVHDIADAEYGTVRGRKTTDNSIVLSATYAEALSSSIFRLEFATATTLKFSFEPRNAGFKFKVPGVTDMTMVWVTLTVLSLNS